MHSTLMRWPLELSVMSSTRSPLSLPHHPRTIALGFHAIERYLVLECVHRAPEPGVSVHKKLLLIDQALEGLFDEFLAGLHVLEDFLAQHEVPAIQKKFVVRHRVEACCKAVRRRLNRMEAVPAADTDHTGDHTFGLELRDHPIERHVGKPIGVIGEKNCLVAQMFFRLEEALPDVGVQTSID